MNTLQQTISGDITLYNPGLYDRFLDYIDVKPKSIETYRTAIRQFLKYLQENQITHPTRQDIINYRDGLMADHKATTVQNYLTAVKLFFAWLDQEGLYKDVAQHVKGVKIDKGHKKDYLTQHQSQRLLRSIETSSLKGKRDYALLGLLITTGLRTVEVQRANVGDMETVGGFTVLFIQGKGRDEKAEYVNIAEPVEDAIRDYLGSRAGKKRSISGKDPLFASTSNNNRGQRMTTRSISRIVKGTFINAGYNSDRLTAHSTRHTAATLNLLNGGSIEETQQMLRHSNINTTMTYAHALERVGNQSENRIAGALFG